MSDPLAAEASLLEALRDAQGDDDRALKVLLGRLLPIVRLWCIGRLRDPGLRDFADDIVQETAIRVVRHLGTCRASSASELRRGPSPSRTGSHFGRLKRVGFDTGSLSRPWECPGGKQKSPALWVPCETSFRLCWREPMLNFPRTPRGFSTYRSSTGGLRKKLAVSSRPRRRPQRDASSAPWPA